MLKWSKLLLKDWKAAQICLSREVVSIMQCQWRLSKFSEKVCDPKFNTHFTWRMYIHTILAYMGMTDIQFESDRPLCCFLVH